MNARRVAIGVWLAGLALCALVVSQARFVSDLSSFLPAAPTEEQRLLVDQLRDGAISRVMLIGIEGGDEAWRADTSRALAARLAADPRFTNVVNGAAVALERERELLMEYRYVLSPHVTRDRFEPAGLRSARLRRTNRAPVHAPRSNMPAVSTWPAVTIPAPAGVPYAARSRPRHAPIRCPTSMVSPLAGRNTVTPASTSATGTDHAAATTAAAPSRGARRGQSERRIHAGPANPTTKA